MKDVVLCPVHGTELKITSRIITFMQMHYNAIGGRCSKCRTVYLDQKIMGIARFTYEGINYQYLPELESWRISKEREDEEERKEAERKEAERKRVAENKKKRLEQQKLEQERKRQEELRKKESALRAAMPSKIYVIRNIGVKTCPVCNRKDSMVPKSLTLQSGKSGLENTTIIGYSCARCHAVFVSEKTAERNFLDKYTEYLNLDYLNTEVQEKNIRQKKLEERFPFLTSKKLKIKISTDKFAQNRCPVHKKHLKEIGWIVSRSKAEPKRLLYGCYCQSCNAIYMTLSEQEKIQNFVKIYGKSEILFKILPAELQHDKINPVSVEIDEIIPQFHATDINKPSIVSTNQKYEIQANKIFDKEIVTVLAQIDGKKKIIHILTVIKETDKRYCTANEILVREAESTGREILGRIANNQLIEFSSKIGVIKISDYKIWPGQNYHLEGFTKFCDPDNIQDIIIMNQKNLAKNVEEYKMVTALVYCSSRQEPVYIDVYYSQKQNKYFINSESYRQYRTRYGFPYVHLVPDEYDEEMDYGNLRQYSELNLYGYTVAKSADMTSSNRQQLLRQLIDNGLMSKHQIVNHLEWLIHRQSGRIMMEDACDCWKEDLKFVNNYHISCQRKICGRFVYGKVPLYEM